MTGCPHIPGRTHAERDRQRRWAWESGDRRVVCVGPDDDARTWPHSCADPDPAYRQAMSDATAAYREGRPF